MPHLILIGGGSGSGKTTIVRDLESKLSSKRVAVYSHDSYYKDLSHLSHEEQENHNFDHPDAIASNELKKYFKGRHSTGCVRSLDQIFEQVPDCRDKELAEAVFSTAFSLRTSEREIFFLYYDSGFSVSDISEITGKKNGNIKVILSNARKNIRTILGRDK